jgi:ribose transport system permease protein
VSPSKTKQAHFGSALSHFVSVWSLLILLVALVLAFSMIKPETFPTYFNFRSIVNNKSVQALLALAVFLPMTANHFDLSVGFLLGISQVLVIGLQGQSLNWLEASGVVLLLGAAVGLVNGFLVTIIGIDSFIATLGTGTLLYGFNEWYTGGQQVVAQLPDSFINISGAILGIRCRRSTSWC